MAGVSWDQQIAEQGRPLVLTGQTPALVGDWIMGSLSLCQKHCSTNVSCVLSSGLFGISDVVAEIHPKVLTSRESMTNGEEDPQFM